MRHRVAKHKLGRTSSHRKALFKNMATGLFRHGRIVTTRQKAKALRPFVERLITLAKKKGLARYRLAIARLGDESVAKKLFDEIAPLYEERSGGYTRILKLPVKRLGDKGENAILELVGYNVDEKKVNPEPVPSRASKKEKRKEKKIAKKPAPAKAGEKESGRAPAAKEVQPAGQEEGGSGDLKGPEKGTSQESASEESRKQ